ncbi:MAG: bifunctional riboflavin kinase/FAD synthetase [Flavobacterium sp.]|nr:bifunctional riboflavin kinase/FAD synthetase [Flavobacterium sp.]
MKIFHSTKDFISPKKTIVTIGTFDGVHVGHQKIIQKIVQNGIDLNLETVILTFFPHPRMVLNGDSDIKLLNTIDEKSSLLEKNGIQNLIIQKFDTAFSELSAEAFVKNILVDQLNIQKIIIGHDHRFGKNRSANIDDLVIFGKKYNFDVEQISVQEIDDVAVSSTKIRNAIIDGKIELANDYLGYKYQLSGEVIDGKKLGRTIGFPTANINISEHYKLIPKNGVYVVKSSIDNKAVIGIMNIGIKPTFNEKKISVEVYFLDFDAELYGKTLTIKLITYIREEQKFESLNDLKNQIETDKQFAIQFF